MQAYSNTPSAKNGISSVPISTYISFISTHIFSISTYILLISTYIFISLCILFFPTSAHAFTISKSSGNTLGLVGWWTFDKMTTGQVTDWSGQGNHGQMVSMSTSTAYMQGKIGQALRFDGVNDEVSIAHNSILNPSEITIAFWFIPSRSSNTNGTIIDKNLNSGYRFRCGATNCTIVQSIFNSTFGAAATVVPDVWNHLVFTGNSSGTLFYVNGIAGTLDTDAYVANASVLALRFGTGSLGSNEQALDDVRIYSRVLTAAEVRGLYNAGQTKIAKTQTASLKNGLVGHWTFDGVTTGTITDQSGNGNHGIAANISTSTFFVAGKIGQAGKFDGVDDYVNMPDFYYSDTQTICAWIYPKVVDAETRTIVAKRNSSGVINSGILEYTFYYTNSAFYYAANDESAITVVSLGSNTAPTINRWFNVCVVQGGNGATAYLYVNGVSEASTVQSGVMRDASNRVQIGVRTNNDNGRYANAIIDDVRIYNRVLSAAEVKQLYALGGDKVGVTPRPPSQAAGGASGLVGHWTFDGKDVTGGTIRDVSGNGYHGIATNISTSTFYAAGKIGQGLNFDGVNDRIDTTSDFVGTSAATVCAWLNPRTIGAGSAGRIVDNGKLLFLIGSATTIRLYSSGPSSFGATAAYEFLNKWSHVCGSRDSSGVTNMYVNGVLSGTPNQDGGTPASGTTNIIIGNVGSGIRSWDGLIDDVRIYNRVLSANEIKQLYNAGR